LVPISKLQKTFYANTNVISYAFCSRGSGDAAVLLCTVYTVLLRVLYQESLQMAAFKNSAKASRRGPVAA